MSAFAAAIVAIMLLLFGIVVGYRIGDELSKQVVTTREYHLANLKVLLVGVACGVAVGFTGLTMLATIPVGGMAGAISGLKMGFGESAGPWKFVDKTFRVNPDHLRRAGSKNAEAVRRARRDGTPEPEVMSVQQDDNPTK